MHLPATGARRRSPSGDSNKLRPEDRPVHDWYRFVLSFPPHLVRDYLERFGVTAAQQVLDPFCGTGTTLVECKKRGVPSVGVEVNPIAHFASSVKVDWSPEPDGLVAHAEAVAARTLAALEAEGIEDAPLFLNGPNGQARRALPAERARLLLADSISPLPLHKTLVLLEHLERSRDERYERHERLALARALVTSISNLQFGPEVGVGPARADAPVVEPWLAGVRAMADDLRLLRERRDVPARVLRADSRGPLWAAGPTGVHSRHLDEVLEPASVDAVITSPPYPNEKDYTRATRLESVLLGFIRTRADLQALKRSLVRSNTRGVYRGDDDDRWVAEHPEIRRIAAEIEARRIALGKTSGFERLYARVTTLYFGGMARHLAELRAILRPGARLAYVVGDQASYLRVLIRTGQLLASIAEALGYQVLGLDLFRTRLATATREQLREEVVVLRWPGERG